MAMATDLAGIQFRTLNSSKGPAVQATRAQVDRAVLRNPGEHAIAVGRAAGQEARP